MSPLGAILLRILRIACLSAAGFVALVLAYEIWLGRGPVSFWVLLAVMLAGFLWLARSMGRELGG